MTLIPYRLTREYIITHPEWTFIHSRCYWPNIYIGPSLVCRDLHNCYGIPVRWKLCKSSGYFQDSQLGAITKAIDDAIEAIPAGARIALFPKIGNGDSRMHILAPKAWAYMMERLNAIKSPNYAYDYHYQ